MENSWGKCRFLAAKSDPRPAFRVTFLEVLGLHRSMDAFFSPLLRQPVEMAEAAAELEGAQ